MTATATGTTTIAVPPTAADRCDRCGARAQVRAVLAGGGDLVFCAHHARNYDEKLREVAVDILRSEDDTEAADPS